VLKISANSVDGQLTQLEGQFAPIVKVAKAFESHEKRGIAMLHKALEDVYVFGQDLFDLPETGGRPMVQAFLDKQKQLNKRTKDNPFLGLVNIAFSGSGVASRSQYATVLHFASVEDVKSGDFTQWLIDGEGIEGRRKDAMIALSSVQSLKNSQGRITRVQLGTAELMKKTASAGVVLPAGVQAPEGFAIVLARVDGSNQAQIIDVLDSSDATLEPVILRYAPDAKGALGSEPLAGFHRAVSILLGLTPAKVGGQTREILIRTENLVGEPMAVIETVSEAYTFPTARMTIAPIPGLEADKAYLLDGGSADQLTRHFEKHQNWRIEGLKLVADKLPLSVQLGEVTSAGKLRVGQFPKNRTKAFATSAQDAKSLKEWFEREHKDHDKRNKGAAQKRTFPASVMPAIANGQLQLTIDRSMLPVSIGSTSADAQLDERTMKASEMEALAETLAGFDIAADGWIVDTDIDDAGLAFEAYIGDDTLQIVIPTRTGDSYNQVCKALTL